MKKSRIIGLLVVFCVLMGTFAANATIGYPCNVSLKSYDSSRGDFGYVYTEYFTGSHCSGDFIEYHVYCSDGATSSQCASSNVYRYYDVESLVGLYETLTAATRDGDRIQFTTSTCIGGGR